MPAAFKVRVVPLPIVVGPVFELALARVIVPDIRFRVPVNVLLAFSVSDEVPVLLRSAPLMLPVTVRAELPPIEAPWLTTMLPVQVAAAVASSAPVKALAPLPLTLPVPFRVSSSGVTVMAAVMSSTAPVLTVAPPRTDPSAPAIADVQDSLRDVRLARIGVGAAQGEVRGADLVQVGDAADRPAQGERAGIDADRAVERTAGAGQERDRTGPDRGPGHVLDRSVAGEAGAAQGEGFGERQPGAGAEDLDRRPTVQDRPLAGPVGTRAPSRW